VIRDDAFANENPFMLYQPKNFTRKLAIVRTPSPLPAEFGVRMTLCIVAFSPKDRTFVTVSDLMLSTDFMSAETSSTKISPISSTGRWICMFAGSPSVYGRVLKRIGLHLHDEIESGDTVLAACEMAFRDELTSKIEGELLSPYGLTRDAFLKSGKGYFGDEEFSRLLYQLNAIKLETSFIVAGFDLDGTPHLFSLADPGVTEDHLNLGFHAIGTGWIRAVGSLFSTYDAALSTVDLIYRICEAKFLGESALGVGKKTFVDVISADGIHQGLLPELVEPIRHIWQTEGIPPVPSSARAEISRSLHQIGWTKSGSTRIELRIGTSEAASDAPDQLKEVMKNNSKALEEITTKSPC
jgi:hypothetical protein